MSTWTADGKSRKRAASSERGRETCARRLALGVTTLLAATACFHQPQQHARLPHAASRELVAGELDEQEDERTFLPLAVTTAEDYVVRVVAGSVTCSGSLIEEDRVLTAHHCLSQRAKDGRMLNLDVAPETVRIELGGDPFAWGEVGVKAIVAPTCGYSGGEGDIAVVVLERRLNGIAIRPVEPKEPPTIGTVIEPIGFGRCFLGGSAGGRTIRSGGTITDLWRRGFHLEASICPGDSGGPALNQSTGEILGVISGAMMDANPDTRERAEFTRLDAWRPVFTQAQAVVDGMSPAELPPIDCR
jgi:hypothetical protein